MDDGNDDQNKTVITPSSWAELILSQLSTTLPHLRTHTDGNTRAEAQQDGGGTTMMDRSGSHYGRR